jgi:SAM-dependent methyltransferase
MDLVYRTAYWLGIAPWEQMARLPIARQIAALLDREQQERQPPLGRALDLGCGSGHWSVDLAARGWQVTGIDMVERALGAARRRVSAAGVEVNFVQGDITNLSAADVGNNFQFVLDFGAIHGLTDTQRVAVGREVSLVAARGATMLLLAWAPHWRGPLPRGMSRNDLLSAFPQWELVAEHAADMSGAPGLFRMARPRFFRLRRM